MVDRDDRDSKKWSYYVELLKSRSIKKASEISPEFFNEAVRQIKTGEISNAMDIRTKLEPITKVKGKKGEKLIKEFSEGRKNLNQCYDEADQQGVTDDVWQRLVKFKEFIADNKVRKEIKSKTGEQYKKCKFEIIKIKKSLEGIFDPEDK